VAGATTYGLSILLPNGSNKYVALFTSKPGPGGGGTEVAETGYARVAISSWVEVAEGDDIYRGNAAAVEFPGFTLPAALSIEAAGVYDAAVAGNLLAWLPVIPIEGGVANTDVIRFQAEKLKFYARAES
jgi:hypothetical protein